jgi:hypothetical protein
MVDRNDYFLYRIDENGDAEIYGRFRSLSEAKLSAKLLMIREFCMILSGDLTKLYFYNDDGTWDYDILTDKGRIEFFEMYQHPEDYIKLHK